MPISLFQFANTKPAPGTIGILFSQSINREAGQQPFSFGKVSSSNHTIQAINVPFESANDIDVQESLQQLTKITLKLKDGHETATQIQATIKSKTRKTGYFFLQLNEVEFLDEGGSFVSQSFGHTAYGSYYNNSINSSDGRLLTDPLNKGSFSEIPSPTQDEAVLLNPFVVGSFTNTDFEPLISNATNIKEISSKFKVDRKEDQANPKNFSAIINRNAELADVQESNYEDTGITNARYAGSKLTNNNIEGDEPLQTFIQFEGSQHDDESEDIAIRSIDPQERVIETFYFNVTSSLISETTDNVFFQPRLPKVSNIIYVFDNETRRYQRVVERKIFILEADRTIKTDESGIVQDLSRVLNVTPSVTPSKSITPSVTPSKSPSPSRTPSISVTPSKSPTPSVTPSTSGA